MDSNGEKSITVEKWGSIGGQSIEKYRLKNKVGQEVDIITYGATITSIRTADKHGRISDVVLGFDNIEGTVKYFQSTFLNNFSEAVDQANNNVFT